METIKELLLAWLTNAIKDRGINNPTPEDIFWIVIENQIISSLWASVYGAVSPRALSDKDISRLINQLISCYHFGWIQTGELTLINPELDKAEKQRVKQRSKERYQIQKITAKENRRQELLDYIADNPRKFGNGKNDETYPEYYLYPTRPKNG